MSMIDVEVRGVREMLQTLRAMPDAYQKSARFGIMRAATQILKDEAVLRAPRYAQQVPHGHAPAGTLKSAIYRTRLAAQCLPSLEVWKVSVRKGKKFQAHMAGGVATNKDAFYATWVEYGIPQMSARPFMRPAFEAKKEAAVRAMATYLTYVLPQVVEEAKRAA